MNRKKRKRVSLLITFMVMSVLGVLTFGEISVLAAIDGNCGDE